MSNREMTLVWLAAALGSGILGAWFADRHKHNVALWACLCFGASIFGLAQFYGSDASTKIVVLYCASFSFSGLIGMFASWFCLRVARQKGRGEQFWAVLGFIAALPAVIIIAMLPKIGPPQRPPLPKRPRSHDDDEESEDEEDETSV